MIVRSAVECSTCDQITTVRIGMGQGVRQEHSIACPNCKEPITFAMRVDYERLATEVDALENCTIVPTPDHGSGPVQYVDANFVIPEGTGDQEFFFPRIQRMQEMMQAAEAHGPLKTTTFNPKAPRRPKNDFLSEWKQLRKAVSLTRNGKTKLARRHVDGATTTHYADDPLDGVSDWLFRFTIRVMGLKHKAHFRSLMDEIRAIREGRDLQPLINYYRDEMVRGRFERYLELFGDFFEGFDEYGQVFFQTALGLPPGEESVVTSTRFDKVKSFYGDAFEIFAGSVDLLAMLNNVKSGRDFETFESMDLGKYAKLDNASKFNPFVLNAPFTALCAERDNQLRNASHHKGMRLDPARGIINFRAGKGGTGPVQEISYANYLHRSTTIFLQVCVLVAVELALCSSADVPLPFDTER